MRFVSIFSGGKDSTYALYLTLKSGWELVSLVTFTPKKEYSWMLHHPLVSLTSLQASAMGFEQRIFTVSGEKEKEVDEMFEHLKKLKSETDFEAIVTGAIASTYQKKRIDSIAEKLGVVSHAPLWHKNQEELLREIVNSGFKFMITSVSTEGLGKEWLGKIVDKSNIEELISLAKKNKFNAAGEGGEYETFVVDCPLFKKPITLPKMKVIWDETTNSGYLSLDDNHTHHNLHAYKK